MSIKIYDTIKPANNSFAVVDADDISYTDKQLQRNGKLSDFMFVFLSEEEYYELINTGSINGVAYNPNTPYLILAKDDIIALRKEITELTTV